MKRKITVLGGFLGSGRSLALKFGFYEKFHRQNRLEIVEIFDWSPKKGYSDPLNNRSPSPNNEFRGGPGGPGTGFCGPGGGFSGNRSSATRYCYYD